MCRILSLPGLFVRTRAALRVLPFVLLSCLAAPAWAALDVSMSTAPGYSNPIFAGNVSAFRITLTNSNGGHTVDNVAFDDNMGTTLFVAPGGLQSYTCTNGDGSTATAAGTVTATAGGNHIVLAGGSVPEAAGGGASGQCDIIVEVTSTAGGTAPVNTIPAGTVTGNDGAAISNGTPAQQSLTITAISAPQIAKSFSPSTIVKSDQPTTLTITISNASNPSLDLPLNTTGDSPAWAVHDALPAGLQVAPAPNASATCTGAGVPPAFTPAAAGTVLTALGGTVAAGGSCTLKVDLVATSTGAAFSQSYSNTINRSTDFGNQRGIAAQSDATASLTVNSLIEVTKQFNPGTVASGQQATLTINIKNASPLNAVTLTSFTDSPIDGLAGSPAYGLTVGTPTINASCAGSAIANTAANRGVTLTGGSIPANSTCTITVPYTGAVQTAGSLSVFTNTIALDAVHTTDASIHSQPASHSVNVVDQLTVDKAGLPTSVAPGNPVQFKITVNNFSVAALTNVQITDALPGGMVALASTPAAPLLGGAGCVGLTNDIAGFTTATPHFTIGTVPAGAGPSAASCTVTFWAMTSKTATVGSTVGNVISIGGVRNGNGAGGIGNVGASQTVNVGIGSTLAVSKVFAPASAPEGTVSKLTLTFTNLSAQDITAASLVDHLPVGSTGQQLIIAGTPGASTTCPGGLVTATAGASQVSMAGASIPGRAASGGVPGAGAAGTCTLTVNVSGAAGNYTNTLAANDLHGTETYPDGTTHAAQNVGGENASLSYAAALGATKTFSPSVVSSGGKSTVTVHLVNSAAGTLTDVGVEDPLPTGMVLATPPNAYTTCGGSTVVAAVAGGATAKLTGAVLPPSGQCNFLFDVIATGAGNWTNSIPIGKVTAAGGVKNVASVDAVLTNASSAGVTVTNTTTPPSLTSPGQVSVLAVTITNGGSLALSNLGLVNYFTSTGLAGGTLNGMVVAPTPGAATTCPGGIVTAAPDGTTVTLSGASLAAGANCQVTVNVTLRTTGTVQDTIPASAITDSQGVSNTLPTVTSLSAGANIGVTKRFVPAVVKPNERSRLRLTFINPVALAVTNLAATDNLPAGVVVPTGPNPTTTCTGATVSAPTPGQVTMTGGSLDPASGGNSTSCIAEIDVVAATAGSYNNVIAVAGVTGTVSGGPVNNPVAANATLEVRSPVTIGKAFNPTSVALGTPTSVTLTLTNSNTVALTGVVLNDNLPSNLSVALVPNTAGSTCGGVVTAMPSATSVVLAGGTIPASGSCVVKFDAVSNVSGIYVNTIPAGNLATNQGVTNENPASATVSMIDPPTVNKQFSPVAIPSGGTSTLTIVLGNTNTTAATLTAPMVDTLPTSPGNIVVAATPAIGGTCTTASVTAAAGSGTVSYASGATIPAGGCTITVNVTGTVEGSYTNTIPSAGLKTSVGNNVLPANAALTISPLGYISGRVFKDNNLTPNGTFEVATDSPIAGIAMTLTGTDYGANGTPGGGDDAPFSQTQTTDPLGNYAFIGLNPGSYTVTETVQPAGTQNGITTAGAVTGGGGGTPGAASAIATTPSTVGTGTSIVLLKSGGGQVASSPNNNFAEVVGSSIAGVVFLDQNNNGVQNAADTALAGVTVQLLNGSAAVVATTTTDSAGAYRFTGLAPGTYTVREPDQPSNTANGQTLAGTVGNGGTPGTATAAAVLPSQIAGIVLPPNTDSPANNFAEVPAGRQVSGRVFIDNNNDGVFNGTDTGLGSVTLNLTGTDFNGLPVSRTIATTSDGRYVFTGLAEGTYTVSEPTQPGGTNNGITMAGSTGGTATIVAVVPSVIAGVNLTGTNSISSDNNFGEIAAPSSATGSIQGRVYVDTNNNGVIDGTETGIAGVTVRLTGTTSTGAPVSLSTVTAADGSYSFLNLAPSNSNGYRVAEVQPADYTDGKTTLTPGNPGTIASSKPVAAGAEDVFTSISLAGGALTNYNFGEQSSGASIGGYVYADTNNNGAKEDGEDGIAGTVVRLTGTDALGAPVNRSTTTGADGSYTFANLQPSNGTGYTVTETQPVAYTDGKTTIASGNPGSASSAKPVASGGTDVIGGIVLANGGRLLNYNFGEVGGLNTLSGFVYVDANNNGVKEADEAPIPGVTVRLTGIDANGTPVDRTTQTGTDGAWAFTNLPASNATGYTVTEAQPGAYADGKTTLPAGNPGTANAAKPLGTGGADTIAGIVLQNGKRWGNYNFGEVVMLNSLSGFVYVDTNNNGVKDGDETGIADVTVKLTGSDANGVAVNLTAVSGADGSFRINNIPVSGSGGYVLTETQPGGYRDGKTTVTTGNPGTPAGGKPVGVGNQDRITGVVMKANDRLVNYLFGEIAIPALKPPIVNGYVWLDRAHTRTRPTDGSQAGQAGWTVVLKQNSQLICTTTTDDTGFYQFDNLHCPGYEVPGLPIGSGFSITFSRDGNTLPAVPNSGGNRGTVPPTGGQIINITLNASDTVVEQNLPLDPAGVVYDSVTRKPVPGAVVTITGPAGFDPTVHLVGSTAAATQVVGTDGLYQFLLQNGFPSGTYTLAVTAPSTYLPAPSTNLPACANALMVGLVPNPALIQASDFAPGQGAPMQINPNTCQGLVPGGSATTQYYFRFVITNGGSAPILNNHIPLDPMPTGALLVTKTTPMVTVSRGGLVPYTITATNTQTTPMPRVAVIDQVPPGFRYRAGSATHNGVPVTPAISGNFLTWPVESFAGKERKTYTLILAVGAGVGDGDYINRAWGADGASAAQISNTASATVRIVPDPTFDCPDIIGKVFDDKNANGYQDEDEPGIPAVRVVTPRGLLITTDSEGRFHVPCADIPNEDHGANFVMKLDDRTLPTGYRLTTENPRDVRITRGKMVKLNFGATVHRVVRIELSNAAFAPPTSGTAGGDDMPMLLPEWQKQFDALPERLKERPSIVRIAYRRGDEPPELAEKRSAAVRDMLRQRWHDQKGQYTLVIETEGDQP